MHHLLKISVLLATLIFSSQLFSHGGEEHGPLSKMAPNGGVLKEIKSGHLELLEKDGNIEIYYYDMKIKPHSIKDVEISGQYTLPRKKPQPISFKKNATHWQFELENKDVHRFDVEVVIDGEKTKWTVD